MFTRLLLAAAIAAVATVSAAGQDLRQQTSSFQHVTARPGATAPEVAPGGTVTLWVDVTPQANVHVYGPGAKDFEPVKLVVTPNRAVTVGRAVFPPPVPTALPGVKDRIPAYSKTFRVTQPVTIPSTAAHGGTVIIAATLNYQACDDKVCFPPASLPLFWRIGVK